MNVLIINTYAGSLLLGAKAAKVNIIATMEDTGYGSYLQALNFPNVPRYEARADWPEKFSTPWRDIDVVAHPPCASFSIMAARYKSNRGTDSNGFACHELVIDYALSHKCRSLTIESVTGAYENGRLVYEDRAKQYGYRITYIFLNAASFGVPQWRPRVWIMFHKHNNLHVALSPQYVLAKSALNRSGTLVNVFGGDRSKMYTAWKIVRPLIKRSWPTGNVGNTLQKMYGLASHEEVVKKFGLSRLTSANPRLVDQNDFSRTLLGNKIFCDYDRPLNLEEYCSIMGFPRNYKWGKKQKDFRTYLSKGVCPPVATWIMKTIDRNASGWTGPYTHESSEFGGVIDLRPKKAEALALARGEKWEPKKAAAKREPHSAVKRSASSDGPHGHSYVLVDKDSARDFSSPQARFIIAALETASKAGMTRTALVELAKGDPEGFPTGQPHDRAVGFWLSKLKGRGALRFAE